MVFSREKIEIKSDHEIRKMRVAGLVVAECLELAEKTAAPGMTTGDLNAAVADLMASRDAIPSFLGYGDPGFPGVICTSVNDEIVHGIPGERVLQAGDLVSVDCGAIVDGWHGDSARSFIVPGDPADADVAAVREGLSEATRVSLWDGIAAAASAKRIGDIGAAIEESIDGRYDIVLDFTGHGIGSQLHMAPDVPNYAVRGRTPAIKRGMCIAIEPMMTVGSQDNLTADDEWTVVTADGSCAAHWEHTVAYTSAGLWVLTAPDGGAAELGARGVAICPW